MGHFLKFSTIAGALVASLTLWPAHTLAEVKKPAHWRILNQYCIGCHNTEDWAGGVAFDTLAAADVPEDARIWEHAIRKLRTGMMPPAGKPRPRRAELDGFAAELAARLDGAAAQHPYAGTVSAHRLNRTEYANAVRDLLAFDVGATTLLPADDSAEGFDNIADVLSVSPTLVQSYVTAAMKISRWAIGDRTMLPTLVKYDVMAGLSQREHIEGLPLGTRGGLFITHNFPLDAEYEFAIAAGTGFRFSGPENGSQSQVDVTLNGVQVDVKNPRKFRIRVPAGPQVLGVALVDRRHSTGVDDLYGKAQTRPEDIESVTINGPFAPTGPGDTPSRRDIFVCYPKDLSQEEACARSILSHLASRAFRRPMLPADSEIDPLLQFYRKARQSGDFESGIQAGIARVLADPRFLYRIEAPSAGAAPGGIYRITDLELASRLSFFLWSSIPDDTLLQIADQGRLSDPHVLEQQVRRMLADPHSQALVDNFAGQWLRLRELPGVQPDDRDFDENLRLAFEQETKLLFADVMHNNRSLIDFLDADYTYVNERLARQYGISNIHGSYMRRIVLPKDSPRRGLLGQGSILTVTSAGNRTSPVQRGAWVMETLFGAPVPQPPPGVDQDLKEDPTLAHPMTVRERLEQHRANPTCAACHKIMDPIGFSLENFDLDGRWRDSESGRPIDTTGTLVDGTTLHGVGDLRTALLDYSDEFVTSTTERLLMYALGRRIDPGDEPTIRRIVSDSRAEHFRFDSIILGIVKSVPFQFRDNVTGAGDATMSPQRQVSLIGLPEKKP
jgi:mono/diheme cytochrome c family protein